MKANNKRAPREIHKKGSLRTKTIKPTKSDRNMERKNQSMGIKKFSRKTKLSNNNGFTITELMITVAMLGILSSIAQPIYFRQLQKTKQGEAANILTFLSTSVIGYVDEFGTTPTTWEELSAISTVMTPSGPVNSTSGKLSCGITIQSGDYTIHRTNGDPNFIKCSPITSDTFIFEAVPTSQNQGAVAFNVISCVDSKLGVSDLKLGSKDASGAVDKTNLISICQ